MNNTITIDATNARNDFFNLLDKVYMGDKTFLIKKAGIPVAELKKPKMITESDINRFSGIWSNKDGEKIKKYAKKFRKEFKIISTG